MRILLVRHGQTPANLDKSFYLQTADHKVPLSLLGHDQARAAGAFVRGFMKDRCPGETARLWMSPYDRTRQTAAAIMETAGDVIRDAKEHPNLVEQQYGLFDGIDDDEIKNVHPEAFTHYDRAVKQDGKYWGRPPMGESRFDVGLRVHAAFGTFHRDAERHGISNLVIVTHGVTLRAFIHRWLDLPYEWVDNQKNPPNCSVHLIENGSYDGIVFTPPLSTDEEPVALHRARILASIAPAEPECVDDR
jgi:2,3-bisphosphoglycerate-dependent phosphoglycerate mutase